MATFLADTTEKLVTKTGLISLVGVLFGQYQRLGHPWLQYVDEAMGRRIIDAFVNILLLAREQHALANADKTMEEGAIVSSETKLTLQERVQALLEGEVPRLEKLLHELKLKGEEAREKANNPPPVVVDLEDFVYVVSLYLHMQNAFPPSAHVITLMMLYSRAEDVKRMQQDERERANAMDLQVAGLQAELAELEKAKQTLEQKLTDVDNYKASDRGQRFQYMEEELARAKLEANQKTHDLRKLEIVIDQLRKKKKSKGSRSGTARSVSNLVCLSMALCQ